MSEMNDLLVDIANGLDDIEAAAKACIADHWYFAETPTDSVESAAEWASEMVKLGEGTKLYMLLAGNPDDVDGMRAVAVTGNGEFSQAHATYLAYVAPRTVLMLIEIARRALELKEVD